MNFDCSGMIGIERDEHGQSLGGMNKSQRLVKVMCNGMNKGTRGGMKGGRLAS